MDKPELSEQKTKHLLQWATLMAIVALAVLALDIMIKNQIYSVSKDTDIKLHALRTEMTRGRTGTPAPVSPENGSGPGRFDHLPVDLVEDASGAPSGRSEDALRSDGTPGVVETGTGGGPEWDVS